MTVPAIAIQLVDFVMRDPRYAHLGLRGSIVVVFREYERADPSPELVVEIARHFWIELDRRNPDLRNPGLPPVGMGSRHYVLEDLSPWQENAIRALEE